MKPSKRETRDLLYPTWRVIRVLVLLSAVSTLYVEAPLLDSTLVAVVTVVVSLILLLLVERSPGFLVWTAYVLGLVLFAHMRAVADQTFIPTRYECVIDLDRLLFVGNVPSVWLQDRFYQSGNPSPHDLFPIAAYVSYFVVPHLFAAALWMWNRALFPVYAVSVLVTYYGGLLLFLLVPTAPPWLAANEGYIPEVLRVVREYVTEIDPRAYDTAHEAVGVNDVAAMPSLHFSATAIVALVLWRFRPVAKVVGIIYAGWMGLALIYLGEHYVTDVLAGGILAIGAWWVATRLVGQKDDRFRSEDASHDRDPRYLRTE